jgi:ABC-type transport system involved in multi-copper enzyme maturation permease subunit
MNPVLRKDILGLLRLKRVAAIQIAFVATLALLLVMTWPQQGVVTLAARGHDTLMLGLIIGQIVLLTLFVPGIAAVSLTEEREANTLDMLYASRLSPTEIILGKIGSTIGFPLLLLVSGLPFVALLSWRGDVNPGQLAWAYLILIVTAIFLAALSLAVSALCRQSATALVVAYVIVLIVGGGVLVPAAIMLETAGEGTAPYLHYARSISPVAAALSLLRPGLGGFGGERFGLLPAWQVFFPFAAVVVAASGAVLVSVLSKPPTANERVPAGAIPVSQRTLGRRLMYLVDDKKARKPIGHRNPLLVKESRTNQLRGSRWMIRIFYFSLLVSMGLALMALYGGDTQHADLLGYVAQVLVAFQVGVIALVSPSLTTPAISGEIENGTFEMLRMSRLSGGRIFWGKFMPSFLPALLPIVALMPAYGVLWFVNRSYENVIFQLMPLLVLAVLFCCTLGQAASSFFASTARATVVTYLIVAAMFVLPMLAWFAAGHQLEMNVARWLCMISPLVMALNLLPIGSAAIAEMYVLHLWLTGGLCVVLLVVARIRLVVLLQHG